MHVCLFCSFVSRISYHVTLDHHIISVFCYKFIHNFVFFDLVNFLFKIPIFIFPTQNDFSHSFLILINFEYDVLVYCRLVLIQKLPQICAWMIYIALSVPYKNAWTWSLEITNSALGLLQPENLKTNRNNPYQRNTIIIIMISSHL